MLPCDKDQGMAKVWQLGIILLKKQNELHPHAPQFWEILWFPPLPNSQPGHFPDIQAQLFQWEPQF